MPAKWFVCLWLWLSLTFSTSGFTQTPRTELLIDAGTNTTKTYLPYKTGPARVLSGSARIRVSLSQRFGFSTGIGIDNKAYEYNSFLARLFPDRHMTIFERIFHARYTTASLPVSIDYRIVSSRIMLDAGMGASLSVPIYDESLYTECGPGIFERNVIQPFGNFILQARTGYSISKRTFLYLQPTIQCSFITNRPDFRINNPSFWVAAGAGFKLGTGN